MWSGLSVSRLAQQSCSLSLLHDAYKWQAGHNLLSTVWRTIYGISSCQSCQHQLANVWNGAQKEQQAMLCSWQSCRAMATAAAEKTSAKKHQSENTPIGSKEFAWARTIERYSITEGQVEVVEQLSYELQVSECRIARVLAKKAPRVLQLSVDDVIIPKIGFLRRLGMSTMGIERVVLKWPEFLLTDFNQDIKTNFCLNYLVQQLGVRKDRLPVIVRKRPVLLWMTERTAVQKVMYLQGLGLSRIQIGCMLDRAPSIFACDLEGRLKPFVEYLLHDLKVTDAKVAHILLREPSLPGKSFGSSILPCIELLRGLDLSLEAIGTMVAQEPEILAWSVEKKLQPMRNYLMKELKMPSQAVGKVFGGRPQVLTHSIHHDVAPRIRQLLGCGWRRGEIGKLVAGIPSIMTFSPGDGTLVKMKFLCKVARRSVAELVAFPQYMKLPFKDVILPRVTYLLQIELASVAFELPMDELFVPSHNTYIAEVAGRTREEYDEYRHNLEKNKVAQNWLQEEAALNVPFEQG
eukprot:evm.model.scf_1623.4 EVM.evm.TU.scf_1623.4   scf_1623:28006-30461(-)